VIDVLDDEAGLNDDADDEAPLFDPTVARCLALPTKDEAD
jgi:hypothetical protein